jgi:hypothetical protein
VRPGLARTATRAALGLALLAAAAGAPAARAGDEHGHDAGAEAAGSAAWQTPAERSGFQSTPSYDETIAFLRRLEAKSTALRLGFYGSSGEGRPLPFVVVSREGAFTPQAAQAQDKPIVMIVAGIHAGEIDGKDALLMILRDVALGEAPELLDAATLLVVPIYNVDGHERVSPFNRPNQDGPRQGMGFRTTASGLDLNRDHVKLESPEARALVGLFNAWRPHLHVDTHVTDGVDLEWTLTFALAEAPQAAPSIQEWWSYNLPPVVSMMARGGHRIGPYVDLKDGTDPAKGFESWVGEPRLSTGYFNLRNRPTLLIEMHSYKPYEQRVDALRDFLALLVRQTGSSGQALRVAVAAAEQRTVAAGQPGAEPSELVLEWVIDEQATPVRVPFFDFTVVESAPLGRKILQYDRSKTVPLEIPWSHRARAKTTVPRPRGYLVLPGWPLIEEKLRAHGLEVRRLDAPAELAVETLRLSEPKFESRSYQGRVRVSYRVARERVTRRVPAGTLFVPAAQPDFEVAAQLLEPESADSLAAWGMLSSVFERKEYIDPSVLHRLATELLKDPQVAAEWEAALASDPALAGDGTARYLWWYRRTPHWDETVGLMPVYRLTGPIEVPSSPLR